MSEAMKVIKGFPPNFRRIRQAFPVVIGRPGILYCYGDTIYNPSGAEVTHALRSHEAAHSCEQDRLGVDQWWEQYLIDRPFRFEQECLAHRVEYDAFCDEYGSAAQRDAYLSLMTLRLSSALYGRMVTPTEARQIILRHVPVATPLSAKPEAIDVVV